MIYCCIACNIFTSGLAKTVNGALFFNFRKNPPGSISGRELGDAAHRLVVNSLQVKGRHRPPFNGPAMSYAPPVGGHRQPLPPYDYESRPGYVAVPPPLSAPPLRGQLPFAPYAAVPTPQYGYDQPYSPPVMHNPHHQSNSYGRNDHQHPRSNPYERTSHHVRGGGARHGYPSSGNNQNAQFVNNTQGGGFASHHHEVGRHNQNFQPFRPSHQNWTPRNNPSGHREHGQHSVNPYSHLDRRADRKPMPPHGYSRK